MKDDATDGRVKLWDAPVRLVHWAMVALVPALWWTADHGNLTLHKQLGHVMLMLVLFRIYWGFVGSSPARFGSFLKGPRAVAAYAAGLFNRQRQAVAGHNPLGGWSALTLLVLLLAQVCFGLFTQDVDGIESGPLAIYVSYDGADLARGWHHKTFDVLLAFIALHIGAVLFYLIVKRDNLITTMVTGRKALPASAAPTFAPAWRAVAGIIGSAGLVWWISLGAPH